ncbi:MAG: DUF4418 family protein [Nitrospirota bacterium]|nr:DUF4418 family protein [Nitrospirota bacterium]
MKRAAGILAVIGGILLILAPRFILPVCEYSGYQPMHCSDTARAELYAGIAIICAGTAVLALHRHSLVVMALLAVIGVSSAALALPQIYGYCKSPKMPCNYGTVPAIRLTAVIIAAFAIIALLSYVKQLLRKEKA